MQSQLTSWLPDRTMNQSVLSIIVTRTCQSFAILIEICVRNIKRELFCGRRVNRPRLRPLCQCLHTIFDQTMLNKLWSNMAPNVQIIWNSFLWVFVCFYGYAWLSCVHMSATFLRWPSDSFTNASNFEQYSIVVLNFSFYSHVVFFFTIIASAHC